MEAEWEEATMAKVGIQYDDNAVFAWAEWCKDMQRKLNKTNAQTRTKYLRGFPTSFNIVIVPEQMAAGAGNYVFAANFPAHHPQAGNPDPAAIHHVVENSWKGMPFQRFTPGKTS